MVQDLNLIVFISTIIGIIAIVLGIDISRKVVGKLRTFMILFILTITIFTVGETIRTLNALGTLSLTYPDEIIKIIVAFFFLLTVISIKTVIEEMSNAKAKRR
ncbi:hypothetical protein A3K62_02275 [Candidatus Pacearchaeota archaeon RBG_16_35_8]|nr:MAG: hypothetical protein A3K62_02275 [Candidatus Pacearchaeota archaeon RBG_16_35_8]